MIALTRQPSPNLPACQLTFLERQPIDFSRALAQHEAYCTALQACGARLVQLPAIDELPDSVFVEDCALVLDEVAVLMSIGNQARREEVAHLEPEIARFRPVERLVSPAQMDGGDILRIGRQVFVGQSTRTNEQGIEALRRLIQPYGYEVIAVPVLGCLHLKSGCTALDDRTLLVNSSWIDLAPFSDFDQVEVPADEPGGANALRLGERVLLSTFYPKTLHKVSQRGYEVLPVDNSEYIKAEGGLTCCSLIFN
jgi:dimethylargininase